MDEGWRWWQTAEESSFWIHKQRPFDDPLMPACRFNSTKFLFLIGPNIVLLFFIIRPKKTVIRFGCFRHLIKYSSPSPERGLTTLFYAYLTMTIVICTRRMVFVEIIIIADILKKKIAFFHRIDDDVGVVR